jgi:hypothetical protein
MEFTDQTAKISIKIVNSLRTNNLCFKSEVMKKITHFKISITLLLFLFTLISMGQISLSQQEIIDQYGADYQEGIHAGNSYLLFNTPGYTKTSGSFTLQTIMFFKKGNDGNSYCFMFQLLEPGSEMNININIYNRDLKPVGYLHWVDPSDGVNYRIEQSRGHSLITAWLGDDKPEIPETILF